MFENDFIVEFNDEELGECRAYPKSFKGYEQAIKDLKLYKAKQNQRISELEEKLKKAIVPKFKVGDYFIEHWDKTTSIYQYKGNNHFKCLNKYQGYHCDYVILGALLLEEGFIKPISKEEAQSKLEELKG